MPFFDNNVIQLFGEARALHLLDRFQPAFVTQRVRREQQRTAPPHAREQLEEALAAGWLRIHEAPKVLDVLEAMDRIRALSHTDAELLVLCRTTGEDLFTDDSDLRRAAAAEGVAVHDFTRTLLMLRELGALNDAALKAIVLTVRRRFTRRELESIGLRGFL